MKKNEIAPDVVLYTQASTAPITSFHLTVPIGNAHSHPINNFPEGSVHFLEHMCFERSRMFPEKAKYEQILAQTGARQNAWTDAWYTDYYIEAPSTTFLSVLEAFLDHVFNPLFISDDIALEVGIIKNERDQRKFYPGDDQQSHYKLTQWMDITYYPRDQIFGSDVSLNNLTPNALQIVHNLYQSLPINIFIAGSIPEGLHDIICCHIPERTSYSQKLISQVKTPIWKKREFHEFICNEVDVPIYTIGYIGGGVTNTEALAVSFVLELLCHHEYGVLQQWIRKERGWSYGLETSFIRDRDRFAFSIDIPLSNIQPLTEIRSGLSKRIQKALGNTDLIDQTKRRLVLERCFEYETITSRLEHTISSFYNSNTILTETDIETWIKSVTTDVLETTYQKFFTPNTLGELLIVPKQNDFRIIESI